MTSATSDKNQAGAFAASGNQNSDFSKTMNAKHVKMNLYTLVVGGFGRHFFEQVLLESLEYSTRGHFRLDSRRIWQIWAQVSMV